MTSSQDTRDPSWSEADAAYPATEQQGGVQFLEYWRMVKRHKWAILGITLVGVLIGVMQAMRAQPVYRAETKLLIQPPNTQMSSLEQIQTRVPHYLFYQTQYEVIQSRAIAKHVVDQLDLVDQRIARRDQPSNTDSNSGEPRTLLAAVMSLEWLNWQYWAPEDWKPEPAPPPTREELREGLISKVQGGISVKGGERSQIVRVSYADTDPERAADIANAVADAYIKVGLESRLSTVRKTTSWLQERLDDLRSKVEQSEAELQAFQSQTGLVDTENSRKIVAEQLAKLNSKLIDAQTERSEAEIQYNQIQKIQRQGGGYESLIPVLENSYLTQLKQRVAELESKVAELSKRYLEKHPKMISAKSDLQEARRHLKDEVAKVVDSIKTEYQTAVAREQKLKELIKEQKQKMQALQGKEFKLGQLERETETNRQLYQNFLEQFKEANVAEDYDVTNVRVIDKARVPGAPFKPDKKRMVGISGFLALFLGIGLAFVRERLDNTFRVPERIEHLLQIPVLATLERLPKRGRKATTPERHVILEGRSPFAEAVGHVRTGILFSNIDDPPKVILVTSSATGEGKTTLATNLAASFGQLGRTLLLEADLRKPRLKHVLAEAPEVGLTDVVGGQAKLQEAMARDPEVENLYIMHSGTHPPNPLEILSSARFARLLEELRTPFDHIIIDSAPILPVSDGVVLGKLVDGAILVVKADGTTHEMAQESVKRLRTGRTNILGAVLDQAEVKRIQQYYGKGRYYYGAYYGYGDKAG